MYDGSCLPDMIKLYSQCFDVHGQIINNNVQSFVSKDYYCVPITVKQLQRDTLIFPEQVVFDNRLGTGTAFVDMYFTDMKDRRIYFNKSNPPEVMLLF